MSSLNRAKGLLSTQPAANASDQQPLSRREPSQAQNPYLYFQPGITQAHSAVSFFASTTLGPCGTKHCFSVCVSSQRRGAISIPLWITVRSIKQACGPATWSS